MTNPTSRGVAALAICLAPSVACIDLRRDGVPDDQRSYEQTNLLSDREGRAERVDPYLVNPWGLAAHQGELWIANAGSGTATIFDADHVDGAGPRNVPVSGQPSGIVRNPSDGFELSSFGGRVPAELLFATLDGKLAAYSAAVDARHAVIVVDNSAQDVAYTGLAIAALGDRTLLYAADFAGGKIDVYDEDFTPAHGLALEPFVDPSLPEGHVPFGIHQVSGLIYVTYVNQSRIDGAGQGYVSLFQPDGKFLHRVLSGGLLNAPWAVTKAPSRFGIHGGDLLIGNFGDGRITAVDRYDFKVQGQLADDQGVPLQIEGLWGLLAADALGAGPQDALYFAAGIAGEGGGLFGRIQPRDD